MMKSQNKYSIRKFSVGASSILIATLLFLSGGQAQAAEKQVNMGNSQEDTVTAQSIGDQQTRENANYQRENGVDEQQHTENLTKNLHNDKTISEENHRKTDDLNKDQLKDDKKSSRNNKNIQRDTTKNNNANPSDVNQGLEQAINDGKQSKVASQQQSKEADNSQDSNANNNLPSQSRTKEAPSLNKLDQTSQREIVNETEIEKVQPQQNNQANDKITNYNFNNEQEVKPQKDEKTLSVSDLAGNEALVRQIVFDIGKMFGNKNSRVDFGLAQWGLKQKPNESYIDYVKRVKQSNLWKSKDNGFYDLTREGATDLNRKTSLNPNIVYKTYTGEATHKALNSDRQKADLNMFFPFVITGNLIGKATEKEWRENDGLVSVISSQHPFNQAYTNATDKIQKGIWQVTPTKHDWDHVDFVGQDSSDTVRTREELQDFWHHLADDLVKTEKVTDTKQA